MPEHIDSKSHANEKLNYSLIVESKRKLNNEDVMQMLSSRSNADQSEKKEDDSP